MASFIRIDGRVVEDIPRWLAHNLLGAIFMSERSHQVTNVGILLSHQLVSLLQLIKCKLASLQQV